jgi:hypothetical protein
MKCKKWEIFNICVYVFFTIKTLSRTNDESKECEYEVRKKEAKTISWINSLEI